MARVIKAVYFNDIAESALLKQANSMPNFSTFVKDCLKQKTDPRQLVSPEIQRQITIFDFVPKQDDGLRNDLEDYY